MKKTINTYNLSKITKKIIESGFILFNTKTLKDIFEIDKPASFSAVLKRIVANKILLRLEKDKYVINDKPVKTFNLANLLYESSYLSFETALNFYGILSQFPYEITSATIRKTISKTALGGEYRYTHLKPELFFGYVKLDGFLIATPEKALLDQIYLSLKGWKKINIDEYDFSIIKKNRLKEYYAKYPKINQTQKMAEIINKILKLC